MFCRYCGKQTDDSSIYCSECGKQLYTSNKKEKKLIFTERTIIIWIFAGAILSIVLFVLFLSIARINATKYEINRTTSEIGEEFEITDIVTVKNKNCKLNWEGEVDTQNIGEYEIVLHFTNGVFSRKKKLGITVADTKAPVIKGSSFILAVKGGNFDPNMFFEVEDYDSDSNIFVSKDTPLDTSNCGFYEITLNAIDKAGNTGELDVTVKVVQAEGLAVQAIEVLNKYIAEGNSTDNLRPYVWVMKTSGGTNGVDYYVEVLDDVLYAIYDDGSIAEYTVDDCGSESLYDILDYAVKYDGSVITIKDYVSSTLDI